MTKRSLDYYQIKARQQGYRSRSAYKLIAIDNKLNLLSKAKIIIELGCYPGGWTQVVCQRSTGAKIIACDLKEMLPLKNVQFVQGDFTDMITVKKLQNLVGNHSADLILADMSPNISGHSLIDQAASGHILECGLNFAHKTLDPTTGKFLTKFFQGEESSSLIKKAKEMFIHISIIKPPASRSNSKENYLYLQGVRRYTSTSPLKGE